MDVRRHQVHSKKLHVVHNFLEVAPILFGNAELVFIPLSFPLSFLGFALSHLCEGHILFVVVAEDLH